MFAATAPAENATTLVITRTLVEQMGGSLRFESEPRVGTKAMLEFDAG